MTHSGNRLKLMVGIRLGGVPMVMQGSPVCDLREVERHRTRNGCMLIEYQGSRWEYVSRVYRAFWHNLVRDITFDNRALGTERGCLVRVANREVHQVLR